MKSKIIIGIVIGFVLGFLSRGIFQQKRSSSCHWRAVAQYNDFMRNPANYKPANNSGPNMASPVFDVEPHLAALVEAGELRHLDIVLPSVPNSREATKLWMRFCESHTNEIVFSTGNPSAVAFKPMGIQPMHLNIWYKEAGESVVQQLIRELEQMKTDGQPAAGGYSPEDGRKTSA